MKYYIEEMYDHKVIYMRRMGQYGVENYNLMCKMKAWADERGLLTNDAVLFGIALDNPQFTKPNECRYDVCLLAPSAKDIATEDQVEIRNLCGGKYAVFTIDHTADAVTNFWKSFPTEMANSGLSVDFSRPIMERYSVKMVTNGLCEMCVPVSK